MGAIFLHLAAIISQFNRHIFLHTAKSPVTSLQIAAFRPELKSMLNVEVQHTTPALPKNSNMCKLVVISHLAIPKILVNLIDYN